MSKIADIEALALAAISQILDSSEDPEPAIVDKVHQITKIAIRARGESITVETAATEIRRLSSGQESGTVAEEIEGGS